MLMDANRKMSILPKKWFYRPYSNTWQTTFMVMLVVLLSVGISLWFFWRSLYLPELKNHARYLASQMALVERSEAAWQDDPKVKQWIFTHSHIKVVTQPDQFPEVEDKVVVGIFTQIIAKEMADQLGRPVTVYFKFTPTAQLWLQDSLYPKRWLREPVIYYSHYSPTIVLMFLLGLPLLTLLAILFLVRQLNRPLHQLQRVANDYIQHGHATRLPTHLGSVEIRQVNLAFNRLFTTLSQAQKERTIMLAGISHDLRTPLTRMRLTAEMLPDEFLKEGLIYDIEDMDAILEQFISFMKDGSDEAVRLTNLDNIFNEIIVQFAPIEFVYHKSSLPDVPLRPLSIKRLIVNLVNNASRYGKPPIHLEAKIIDTPNPSDQTPDDPKQSEPDLTPPTLAHTAQKQLVICVKDCGDGVAEDQLERIMQPFERGETARTTQGSGLGLAIVNRIAKLHHGTVQASNQDGGFEVCIFIPLLSSIDSEEVEQDPD